MKWVYPTCCVAVACGVLAVCWYASEFLRTANASLQANSTQIVSVLGEVHNAATSIAQSAQASKVYQESLLRQAGDVERDTRLVLDHFDRRTLPAADNLLARASLSIDGITGDADRLTGATYSDLGRMGTLLDGLRDTDAQLQARIADPQITALLGHFDVLALHLDGIAANSEAMSTDLRTSVHRLAQPPSKVHQFLNATYTTLKFGSLFLP